MKLNLLTKGLSVLMIGGTVLVSSVAWNGSTDLTAIKDALTDKQSKLEQFQENETQLISKVNELKGEVAEVTSELETLQAQAVKDQEKIQALETEKAGLLSQIADLEGQLAEMVDQEEAESLRTEITRLEGELTKANEEVKAVKDYLATLEDITPSDIAGVVGEGEAEEVPPSKPTLEFNINTVTESELNDFLTTNGGSALVTSITKSGGKATIKLNTFDSGCKEVTLLKEGLTGVPTGSKITSANGNALYTWE